ncbi:pirin family protein [Undibacterium sp. SXout20W]|uniref:pirin family protein n=1 Tax=Undibacterium sp. SXout20W TaxID=3413051 RepID=UPI003BF380EE
MITLRLSQDRGPANHGWLKSFHSFSFAEYYDPQHMGFGPLRVINDDWIAPAMGFGTHPHKDMEIITYVLEGAIAHKDSMNNGSTIRPGNVQYMSAGTGVRHSEFNPSSTEHTQLLQIWIQPDGLNLPPLYEEKEFSRADKEGKLCLVASGDGAEGSIKIRQNARLLIGLFDGDQQQEMTLHTDRLTYVHLARGELTVNGIELKAGDAMKLQNETLLKLSAGKQVEVLVFDLPQ